MTTQATFEQHLAQGRTGEAIVTRWLQGQGFGVIPSYDFTGSDGDVAPKLKFLSRSLVVPDLDVCRSGRRCWVEVKNYYHAAFNRSKQIHVHGIKARHHRDYLRVQAATGDPVYLAIVERDTGAILVGRLDALPWFPCQCRPCKLGLRDCNAPVKESVYCDRAAFREIGHVTADEQAGLLEPPR